MIIHDRTRLTVPLVFYRINVCCFIANDSDHLGVLGVTKEKGEFIDMGRVSVKENKTLYQVRREELGLSREKAAELLETIPPERIEKIENQKSMPHPDEVLIMAESYKMPKICNYYCANDCPIGKQYVPEIKQKDLSQIVLEMLASLNAMEKKQERLIEITVDGKIEGEEIKDFIHIQEELERISITVESLQLWVEQMLADGTIDVEEYNTYKNRKA